MAHPPTCFTSVRRWLGTITGKARADKPAYKVKFLDGSEPSFYVDKHPRAKEGDEHIYLNQVHVKVRLMEADDFSDSSEEL